MIRNEKKLKLAISIYNEMDDISWNNNEVVGKIQLNQDNLDKLFALDQENLVYPVITVDEEQYTLKEIDLAVIGLKECSITLQPPRSPNGKVFFAKDINDLLSINRNKYEIPEHYYICSIDYHNKKRSTPKAISNYQQTVKLINLLKTICDHSDFNTGSLELIFLCKNKLTILVNYEISNDIDLSDLNLLLSSLSSEPHKTQKVQIFKNLLLELLINIPSEERFNHILLCFNDLYSRFKDNYNMFLSEFTFERIREEIESRKLEFTARLNKIFSDIQNKILAIPIALVIIGTQFKNEDKLTLNNTLILGGSIVFSILMFILLLNQKQSLDAINDSIDSQKDNFRKKYASLFNQFESIFIKLETRHKQQSIFLLGIVISNFI